MWPALNVTQHWPQRSGQVSDWMKVCWIVENKYFIAIIYFKMYNEINTKLHASVDDNE